MTELIPGVMPGAIVETLARRERAVVLAGLAGIAGLAWVYLLVLGGLMEGFSGLAMAALKPWSAADFLFMFVMWAVMMVAMMLPSAAPMILLFAALARKGQARGRSMASSGSFAAGYLAIWTLFSAAATLSQWGLEQAALLSPMMVSTSPYLGGVLLIAAGTYQMTPLKQACLKHCRSPVQFLTRHWRKGPSGAFRMGVAHGLYCLGCCWVLMGLLFFGGVMNLLWIAAIAAFVVLEKVGPRGPLVGQVTGGVLAIAGLGHMLQV